MRKFFFRFLPVIIVFGLLAADKIVLIPAVQHCCVRKGPDYFYEALNRDFPASELLKASVRRNKKTALSFGSSVSYGFYFNKYPEYHYLDNKFSGKERQILENWEIVNFTAPGSSMLGHLVRLIHALDSGIRPDLIIMELAPNSFNSVSRWNDLEITETLSFDFVKNHWRDIPYPHLKRYFTSRIFALTRFRLGRPLPENETGKDYFRKFMIGYLKDGRISVPLPASSQVGSEKIGNMFAFQTLLLGLKDVFRNYSVDPDLRSCFERAVLLAEERKIPIVFWFPALHPELRAYAQEVMSGKEWTLFIQGAEKKKDFMYYNMNQGENKCEYYIDPMHMGVECFGETFPLLLKKAGFL